MDWSTLELKVISCRDLKAFNFFQKLSAYSVVSILIVNEQAKKKEEQQKHLQRQKTSIQKGGKNPEWNHVFQFDLQSLPPEEVDHLFLKFDLRSEGLVDRTIGEVRVPLKDLIDEFCGVVRFVSYQVRNSDGKPNGVLNFSYKLIGRIKKSGNGSPQVDLSPEIQFSSKNVVYPKLEQDNRSSGIQYPSLDDVYNPSPVFHCQTLGGYYGRNSGPQGLVPGGFLHPYLRSSPVAQRSATYWVHSGVNLLQERSAE
ncbi:protein SRC2 homolog [Durio zibethinus]|uniref:Protein SRC2 homolog n=1 Tax=Durio zibethinus TaxID=66656 RepID=A0A6P5YJI9_DURZI|nr:protein SRC2 homolog [Durio zibethinus]